VRKSRKLFFAALIGIPIALMAAMVFYSTFIWRPKTSGIPVCVNNLRNIEICRDRWSKDENRTTNDVPTWDDLRPYFPDRWSNSIPICPSGGTYTIGRIGEPPTCSIGGPEHSWH